MKKIFIILVIVGIISSAYSDELDYQTNQKSIQQKQFLKLTVVSAMTLGPINSFLNDTGDSKQNLNKYLTKAISDNDWQLGNYYLEQSKSKISVKTKDINQDVYIPSYDKALEAFSVSARKGNVLSAYQGFSILEDQFMVFGSNAFTKKYMRVFAEVLQKQNYCKGYLYNARTYTSEFGTSNPQQAVRILNSSDSCTSGEGYDFYKKDIRLDLAKESYIQKLREKR